MSKPTTTPIGHLSQKLMSQLIHHMKYARYLPDLSRRENYAETVDRNKGMHLNKFPGLHGLIEEAYGPVYQMDALPSMRTMQFGGAAIEVNNARGYNCCGCAVDNYKIFSETFFLLLSGCGVGYSVQKHHVEQLPKINKGVSKQEYVIEDTIEGWADSVKVLTEAFFFGQPMPIFRYDKIRPKGKLLKTSGGRAPGAEPLKKCLRLLYDLFNTLKDGDKLLPIHCHHTMCIIADAVLSGGIRRSSLIALFSWDDEEMISCKSLNKWFDPYSRTWRTGDWYPRFPYLSNANNSIVALREWVDKDRFSDFWKVVEENGTGEPGLFWTNSLEMFCNPCAEIALKGFCNLTEVNVSNLRTQEDFFHRVRMASRIATLQASYTDFHYLRPCWKQWAENDALIGVGMTGIAAGHVLDLDMTLAAEIVKEENAYIAGLLGINPAARCTTVKPSGTTSLLLSCSSGIHAYHDEHYLRRVTVEHGEPIYAWLNAFHPEILERHHKPEKEVSFITIPMKAPAGGVTRSEGPFALLDRVSKVYNQWVKPGHRTGPNTNNVSCTVNVKPDQWGDVGEWMWENRESYAGLAVFPHYGGEYQHAPHETITEEEYNQRVSQLRDFNVDNFTESEDNTNLKGEAACAGGLCELV